MTKQDLLEEFDKQFGTDGPEKNSDSIGRNAGCDDCSINIQERAEHRAFISQLIDETNHQTINEVIKLAEGMKTSVDELGPFSYPVLLKYRDIKAFNQALNDLIAKLKEKV